MEIMLRIGLLCFLAGTANAAWAATGYKCVGADGAVSFQDKPCAGSARTQEFEYGHEAPPPAAAEAVPDPATPDETEPPPPPPAEVLTEIPPAPIKPAPDFYVCTRFDGERYYSDDGVTQPYQAPASLAGTPQGSLDQAYGNQGKLGVSAPGKRTPAVAPPGGAAAAAGYVWVQDECRRLSPEAACIAIRDEHDAVKAKLKHSFKEDRPPLEAREAALAHKLEGC